MSYVSDRDMHKTNRAIKAAIGPCSTSTGKSYDILQKAYEYYKTPGILDTILPYLDTHDNHTDKPFSLRDFETFNVHVAPWINATFFTERIIPGTYGKEKSKDLFIIYQQYKLQLKCYSKETFDPFRRGHAFEFFYTTINKETGEYEQGSFFTAICQLNYFLWISKTGIMNYIIDHYKAIGAVIKELEKIKKSMTRDEFKNLILEKQRLPYYYILPGLVNSQQEQESQKETIVA
jgi:hypothetical protein